MFLHTDKTVYQPGDIIYFRLLVLNAFLKPLLNIKPDLTLKVNMNYYYYNIIIFIIFERNVNVN